MPRAVALSIPSSWKNGKIYIWMSILQLIQVLKCEDYILKPSDNTIKTVIIIRIRN